MTEMGHEVSLSNHLQFPEASMKKATILLSMAMLFPLYAGTKIMVPVDAPTIRTGLDRAEDGDTVFVRNGTYNERVTLKDGVVLLGESVAGTIIKGKSGKPVVTGADRAVLKNFTIENGDKGVLCEGVIMTIEHNCIRNNRGSGIHCLLVLPHIVNNVIYRNEWSGIYCEGARTLRVSIENNVIGENGNSGIILQGNTEVVVQNNVFLGNKQFGIWVAEGAKRSRIIFNDFYMNRVPYKGFAMKDPTNFGVDPQYGLETNFPAELFSRRSEVLRMRGKDSKDIGLIFP
jgi:nitrous oxidase accessory protein NosD